MFHGGFAGRYGIDQLSIFTLCLAVLLISLPYAWIAGILLIAYIVFRAMSRNLDKRRHELWVFEDFFRKAMYFIYQHTGALRRFFSGVGKRLAESRMMWSQRKQYVFPKCPDCKGRMRLPKHKGTLIATCPSCRHEFKIKT